MGQKKVVPQRTITLLTDFNPPKGSLWHCVPFLFPSAAALCFYPHQQPGNTIRFRVFLSHPPPNLACRAQFFKQPTLPGGSGVLKKGERQHLFKLWVHTKHSHSAGADIKINSPLATFQMAQVSRHIQPDYLRFFSGLLSLHLLVLRPLPATGKQLCLA